MGFTNPYPASRLTLDATASINSGLVAFYPLTDETSSTALDISGNYHNGTMTNGAYFTGSTGIGRCAFFDGSNDYCTTGNAALSIDGSVGSISFWFKSNASQTGARLFEFGSSSSTGRSIGVLITSSGDVTFRYRQSSTNSDVTGPALSSLGSGWNFAVATWDASNNINLYINGTKYTGLRTGSINVGNLDRGYIAERALEVPLGKAFQGEMQNVRCWTVELSQAQVDLLYARPWEGTNYGDLWPYSPPAAGSMTLSTDTAATSLLSGMQAWFPLTEGSGTSAQCVLHPSHVGSLNGTVSWSSGSLGADATFGGGYIDTSRDTAGYYLSSTDKATVSFWLKRSSSAATILNNAFGNLDSSNSADIAIFPSKGEFGTYTLLDVVKNGTQKRFEPVPFTNYEYNHFVVVFDGTNCTLYVDGSVFNTLTTLPSGNFANTNGNIEIGGTSLGSFQLKGSMQNVMLWNRALSSTEAQLLFDRPWEGIEYGDTFHYDPPAPASMLPLTSDAINTDQVGWWPLTETDDYASGAADISGGGNNGTQSGGVISEVSLLGGVASFDGSDDRFSISTDLSRNQTAFSCSAWIKPDAVDRRFVWYESNSIDALQTRFGLRTETSGDLQCVGRDDDGDSFTIFAQSGSGVVSTNKWQHVVGIFDPTGNGCKVFLDGVDVTSSSVNSGDGFPNTASLVQSIGTASTNYYWFDGLLSNVRVWSRALTADEVWSIYANPWLGSNYKLASGSTPLYNYIFRTERFRRLG